MGKKLVRVQPVRPLPQSDKWEEVSALSEEEMADVFERANRVRYTIESALVASPPNTNRIRLNDPTSEGYHRDYLATIE